MRIVIVDDHNLFREGLAAIIQQEPDIEVVGLAGTVAEATAVVNSLKPDIVLMDYILPDGTGAEAAHLIVQNHPACKIVFLTMSEKEEDIWAAIRSGAVGYLLKNISPSKLVASLRSVHKGESALSRTMTLQLMKEFSRTKEPNAMADPALAKLTPREKDILAGLAEGKTNQEIAQQLFISENTVKYHVHSILEKLNIHDRRDVIKFAKELRAKK